MKGSSFWVRIGFQSLPIFLLQERNALAREKRALPCIIHSRKPCLAALSVCQVEVRHIPMKDAARAVSREGATRLTFLLKRSQIALGRFA
jgi:hypothetical protein